MSDSPDPTWFVVCVLLTLFVSFVVYAYRREIMGLLSLAKSPPKIWENRKEGQEEYYENLRDLAAARNAADQRPLEAYDPQIWGHAYANAVLSPGMQATSTTIQKTASEMKVIEDFERRLGEANKREFLSRSRIFPKYVEAPGVKDGECPHPSATIQTRPESFSKFLVCDHCGAFKEIDEMAMRNAPSISELLKRTPWQGGKCNG